MGKNKWNQDSGKQIPYLSAYHSKPKLIYINIALLVILLLLLTGCVTLKDPEGSQEHRGFIIGTVDSEHSIGQSFVSRRARLNGIDLWLNVDQKSLDQVGTLSIELYHTPDELSPLAVVSLPVVDIGQGSPTHIDFPPQADPPGQKYYISISATGGSIQVLGRDEDTFPDGSAFHNGMPVEADAAFRLSYKYDFGGMFSDLQRFISNAWLIIPLGTILILPGWLLLNLSGMEEGFDSGERIASSVGLSLATVPILMIWTSLLGITWGKAVVLFTAGLISALSIWRMWSMRPWKAPKISGHGLALTGIFFLTLAVRLVMVRDLFAPAWVDSIHHGVITRLILETGSIPDTYSPFLDIDSANYHPGFHSVLATFVWLSGIELQTGMLVVGQVLNSLVVYAVYLFTVTLVRDRTAGIIAALITGLITPMPAYYSSWGRYTQLAGLLILLVAFALIKLLTNRYRNSLLDYGTISHATRKTLQIASEWKPLFLAGVAIGGLFLTHYRVAAFLGCLVIADFVSQAWPQRKMGATWRDLLREIVSILLACGFAILLVLPWLPPTFTELLIPKISMWRGSTATLFEGFAWVFLNSALGQYALVLSGLGLLLGIIKRRWFTLTLIVWVAMLFILANLSYLGLPGGTFINNLSVEIALFIPISTLVGYLMSEVISACRIVIPARWHHWYYWCVGIMGVIIGLIGARHLLPILNPITFLYREADRPGLIWLEENIPVGETVLINPFAWGYGLYGGNDGGYWTAPLAGHKTIPPPVLYGLENSPDSIQRINDISQKVIEIGNNAEELSGLMSEEGIHYVYIGVRGGPISPRALRESPLFDMLYAKDGTWVFRENTKPK